MAYGELPLGCPWVAPTGTAFSNNFVEGFGNHTVAGGVQNRFSQREAMSRSLRGRTSSQDRTPERGAVVVPCQEVFASETGGKARLPSYFQEDLSTAEYHLTQPLPRAGRAQPTPASSHPFRTLQPTHPDGGAAVGLPRKGESPPPSVPSRCGHRDQPQPQPLGAARAYRRPTGPSRSASRSPSCPGGSWWLPPQPLSPHSRLARLPQLSGVSQGRRCMRSAAGRSGESRGSPWGARFVPPLPLSLFPSHGRFGSGGRLLLPLWRPDAGLCSGADILVRAVPGHH